MSTYNGRVVVVGQDGTEIPATANLRSYLDGHRAGWDGALTAMQEDVVQMANWREGRLRFPDGREAAFIRPDTSEWVSTGRMMATGQGEAPF
jgi:hypothetical protein